MMNAVDAVKNESYMILAGLAFQFFTENSCAFIRVVNLSNIKQTTILKIVDSSIIHLCDSTMSEANMYKSLAIAERNKSFLIEGYRQWVSTQRK
jgi:hypothetical protein